MLFSKLYITRRAWIIFNVSTYHWISKHLISLCLTPSSTWGKTSMWFCRMSTFRTIKKKTYGPKPTTTNKPTLNIPSQNSCRPNFSGTNIFLGPANVDEVFADFESQGLEGPDAILQGASMQTAGLALLWSRVLAILRTGNKMQRMVYQRLFFSLWLWLLKWSHLIAKRRFEQCFFLF